jgi:glycerol transport system substrate-binding protein
MKLRHTTVALAVASALAGHAWAGEAEAKKWIDSEFQPSTLSKDQQMAEMKWFIEAAKKLQAKGVKEISVVSETITTHEYESKDRKSTRLNSSHRLTSRMPSSA